MSHRVPVVLLFPHRVRSLALPLAGMRRARANTGAGHDAGQGVAAAFSSTWLPLVLAASVLMVRVMVVAINGENGQSRSPVS